MNEILGCMFKSTAGRDKGRILIIISKIDDRYVLVADGKFRKLEKPKMKKLRHLEAIVDADIDIIQPLDVGKALTNKLLRDRIGAYEKHICERL